MPALSRLRTHQKVGGALCLLAIVAGPKSGFPQPAPTEYQVKAAFLYNFVKFVEWPAAALPQNSPVRLCVLGQDPFGSDLESTVAGRVLNGRPLLIRRSERLEDLGACHVLFISSSERAGLATVLAALKEASVLTVGETDGFATQGGMIRLTLEENKVRFEINVQAAERARLRISSQLLRLAKRLVGAPPGPRD